MTSDLNWYIQNQSLLLERYNGRVLLISKNRVVRDFSTKLDAFRYSQDMGITPGDFIIIDCCPGRSAYEQYVPANWTNENRRNTNEKYTQTVTTYKYTK